MAKITPLGDRVLIQAVDETEQMRNGIYIPDSAKEKPQEATVIALGTGGKESDGDEIVFHEDHILAVHDSHRQELVLGMDAADLKELAQWLGSNSE